MILFVKITDDILFSRELGVVLKVTDQIWVATPYSPEYQGDSLKIHDSLIFFIDSKKSEFLKITDHVSFLIEKPVLEPALISEQLSFFVFTQKSEGVTISENVSIVIISGSGIINGSTINGAII